MKTRIEQEELPENHTVVNQPNYVETCWGKEAVCPHCGSDLVWVDCWNCEDGYSYHDCGEDCCCCLDPQPNVVCDICDGEGGWYVCINSLHSNHTKEEKK